MPSGNAPHASSLSAPALDAAAITPSATRLVGLR